MKYEIKIGTICNNNCVFCLNSERGISIPKKRLLSYIDCCVENGVDCVQFTGGEATIRRDILELLHYAKNAGLSLEIQTNGRSFSYERFAKEITKIGISSFLISLHAHNEELSREICGTENAYIQAVKGIRNLIGLNQNVSINVVVSNRNARFLPEIISHHAELKPDIIQISWLRPEGKVLHNMDLLPKYSENIGYVIKAIQCAERKEQRIATIGIPLCLLDTHSRCSANPYTDTVAFNNEGVYPAEELFQEQKKTFLEQCNRCEQANSCGGVFQGYHKIYGGEEFRPVFDEESKIKEFTELIGETIKKVKIIRIGYSSKTYSAQSEKNMHFVKQRERMFCDEEKAEALKQAMINANIPVMLPKIKKKTESATFEVYTYLENNFPRNRQERLEMIKEFAETAGRMYSLGPFLPEKEDPCQTIRTLSDFARSIDCLSKDEKEKINELSRWIESNRVYLKKTLIHNDLHSGNFIINNLKIKFITDFEKVTSSFAVCDAATFLYDFSYIDGKFDIEIIREFIKNYSLFVTAADVQAIYPFMVFTGIHALKNAINAFSSGNIAVKNKQKIKYILDKLKGIIENKQIAGIANPYNHQPSCQC